MAEYHVGLDVSLDETSICVVDQDGKLLIDAGQVAGTRWVRPAMIRIRRSRIKDRERMLEGTRLGEERRT